MGDLRPDIEAAKKRMRTKIGSNREIKKLSDHLWEGEQVELMTAGVYGQGSGLLVLTDRRLLFLKDGYLSKTTEDFPLDKVSSVQWSSVLLLGTITIFASNNKAEIKQVNKDDGRQIVDAVRARLAGSQTGGSLQLGQVLAQQGPSAPQHGAEMDVFDRLRKLGELRDLGVVSDDEFEAKKADLLSRI